VAYCRACKLRSLEAAVATTKFNEMVSLSEKKLESLAKRNPDLLRQCVSLRAGHKARRGS